MVYQKGKSNMKVYYAHFMGIYDTPTEQRDVETLTKLGLTIVNPNSEEISAEYNKLKNAIGNQGNQAAYESAFEVFFKLVRECEVFAFRALPNGRIPGGVAMELKIAQENNKIVIELPCSTFSRSMGGEETREFLRDIGKR
jgi:hypothetical protein